MDNQDFRKKTHSFGSSFQGDLWSEIVMWRSEVTYRMAMQWCLKKNKTKTTKPVSRKCKHARVSWEAMWPFHHGGRDDCTANKWRQIQRSSWGDLVRGTLWDFLPWNSLQQSDSECFSQLARERYHFSEASKDFRSLNCTARSTRTDL